LDKTLDLTDESISDRAAKQLVKETDFTKVLEWDTPEKALQFLHALTKYPPLQSIVVHMTYPVCEALYQLVNKKNRRLRNKWVEDIVDEIKGGHWVVNGATLVFSTTAVLLDGQHRLKAAIEAKSDITTHVVFGLQDNVFDRIDQVHKKTAGDMLYMQGIQYENEVAAAVRWVMWIQAGATKTSEQAKPHEIRKAAQGRMKDIENWIHHGHQVRDGFKIPPSMVTALLYLISRHDRSTAENFCSNWLHGNRTGIARNFEVLSQRMMAVKRQSGGALNREVLFAMLIQTFNHWHSGIVAPPQAVSWKKTFLFPRLEFDKAAFLKIREKMRMSDSTIKAQQLRVLDAMVSAIEGDDARVKLSNREIAARCNIHQSQVGDITRSLIADGKLKLLKRGGGKDGASVYRISDLIDSE